jgi:hypothetical protein
MTDPTYTEFTNDADNPLLPPPITLERVDIAGASEDQVGYLVNGTQYCLVRLTRPVSAAASMYGHYAIATAVAGNGSAMLRASGKIIEGRCTRMAEKAQLLQDPAGMSATLKVQAIEGAVRDMLIELAVELANDEAGI